VKSGFNFSSARFVVKGKPKNFTSIPKPTCTLGLLKLGISDVNLLLKCKHKQGS